MSMARWIRLHSMAIASVGLVVDVVVTAVGCIYIWQKSTSDPALKVALIGDVVAGSAGVIGIVAAIIAVATYAATVGAPTLSIRVRVGDGAEVTPADGQSVLRVACESPQAGIRKLMLDPLLRELYLFIVVTNTADYTAANTFCRLQMTRLTGLPRVQRGWSLVAPAPGWSRSYEWDGDDRSIINQSERALPALSLAGASLSAETAELVISVQAERAPRRDFTFELRAQ